MFPISFNHCLQSTVSIIKISQKPHPIIIDFLGFVYQDKTMALYSYSLSIDLAI